MNSKKEQNCSIRKKIADGKIVCVANFCVVLKFNQKKKIENEPDYCIQSKDMHRNHDRVSLYKNICMLINDTICDLEKNIHNRKNLPNLMYRKKWRSYSHCARKIIYFGIETFNVTNTLVIFC